MSWLALALISSPCMEVVEVDGVEPQEVARFLEAAQRGPCDPADSFTARLFGGTTDIRAVIEPRVVGAQAIVIDYDRTTSPPLASLWVTKQVPVEASVDRPTNLGPWVLGAATGVSALLGFGFGASALESQARLADAAVQDELRSLARRGHDHAVVANAALGTAAVLGIATLIWLAIDA